MNPLLESEVSVLVFSQMGFCVIGIFLNNVVFITLKDLPEMKATTHNVILAHLTLVNLIVCTIVKPITAVYIAYAHAKGEKEVGLEFCILYTLISWSTLSITPWSLFLLSWHILFSGKRARERAIGIPRHATNVFGEMIPLARAFIDSERSSETFERPGDERRNRLKARSMDDGPRRRQKIVLVVLWIGAGAVAIAKYMAHSSDSYQRIQRSFEVRPSVNNSHYIQIIRDTDITFCQVWNSDFNIYDQILIVLVLLLPLAIGPFLTAVIEVGFLCFAPRNEQHSTPSRWRPLALVHSLALVSFLAQIINLWGAEVIVGEMLRMEAYWILLVKYVAGYMDLLLSPLIIMIFDKRVGEGIAVVYRIKRLKRVSTMSSSSLSI